MVGKFELHESSLIDASLFLASKTSIYNILLTFCCVFSRIWYSILIEIYTNARFHLYWLQYSFRIPPQWHSRLTLNLIFLIHSFFAFAISIFYTLLSKFMNYWRFFSVTLIEQLNDIRAKMLCSLYIRVCVWSQTNRFWSKHLTLMHRTIPVCIKHLLHFLINFSWYCNPLN